MLGAGVERGGDRDDGFGRQGRERVTLRVVGAGLGRTGTNSLKVALEQLLEGPCYHMFEVIQRPSDTPVWHAAALGESVDWEALFADYVATVDWPAAAYWREIHAANPDALVLLSTRDSAETWWGSMSRTIVATLSRPVPAEETEDVKRRAMIVEMMKARFTADFANREAAIAAYEAHNEEVRRSVGPERLIEWQPSNGWEPICAALELPAPPTPFPHENTTDDFRSALGLDGE
jgi:hypothetical protein